MIDALKLGVLIVVSVAVLIMTSLGYGLFRMLLGPPILKEACEIAVTNEIHLRIQAFICDACGDPRKYEISRDSGDTWEEIYTYLNNDAEVFANCNEFQVISETQYLLNIQTLLPSREIQIIALRLKTSNGGETWEVAND